jgi:acetoin utilization protein AcuC
MKPWSNPQKPSRKTRLRPSTIGGINRLSEDQKRAIYARVIPPTLLKRFQIHQSLLDDQGRDLFVINGPDQSTSTEISLFHRIGFPDPVLYGHITDTINAQIHILFYILNNPFAPRFDIDRLPDGRLTQLGIKHRNIQAEIDAINAGLSPGQIREGPHILREALATFESFIVNLEHDLYFAEPLYYHNAVVFEHYGFAYQQGRRLMQRIQSGFSPGGDLLAKLDSRTPFRQPQAANSVRLRSWAIHDGILGEPFRNVTMYKQVGKHAGYTTCTNCSW